MDNDGGHYDWMAEPFVAAVLKPLIEAQPSTDDYRRRHTEIILGESELSSLPS